MSIFNDYLKSIEDNSHRNKLESLFNWIHKKYPNLETTIKWNQPMFIYNGTFIIGFSSAKQHFSITPEATAMEEFNVQIRDAGYSQTKNLYRILWSQAIDYDLLEKIIDFKISEKQNYKTFWVK
ncbi:iron chaperone [Staphylococcus kloosii]|uniref:YdhG-like domain-containing protein n=1 Tax=Staphylococcus kloosii TaxID=29384 RepID=A0ABQ0XNF0_9STAP|nr:DUF1801 domain-containing protein [Staphylococcus kloosii]AVQ34677.1 iron chaperone [Staphylococcus kloosii]MCD8879053.1 DUF1801 domain-containing protein [Staphylococcus kloosii]PNZ07592.1 iron chaperone [Staphylococcus kloosii]SUM50230.1 Uncharacterized conserved protein [Staphylococcus kloosii]GEP82950.1 hypothetical protein SKL01_21280 [Staphylococcus kloosii]